MKDEPGTPRHVVVVGLMGAGKSEVGRRLAARLGRPWRDSDREIEAATGLTVRQLRDRDGADAMHAIEARQLLDALAEPGPSVISAAASTGDVPEFGATPLDLLTEQAARRDPLLESLDPIDIDVDAPRPDETASRALEALR